MGWAGRSFRCITPLSGVTRRTRRGRILLTVVIIHTSIAINIAIDTEYYSMRTVQITLEEDLVEAVDLAARRLKQSRSAFTREALRNALARLEIQTLEQQHREGYLKHPVSPGEFSDFEDEQVWVD